MKKTYFIIIAVVAVLLSSCKSSYHFCQIYETKPVNHDGDIRNEGDTLRYENEQCVIDYNFWSNGGSADFYFYNKTDEIIYIDLAKSFYVSNGIAYDLYGAREWSQSSSVGMASSVSYNYGESVAAAITVGAIVPSLIPNKAVGAKATKAASRSASLSTGSTVAHMESYTVTTKEKQIVAVPPHTRKYIRTHNIAPVPYLSCDLHRYPSTSARMDFSADNSPYCFSDVITYTIGENKQPITVNGDFYVSSVTNYAEPEIIVMKERGELCENMRGPDYVAPTHTLYDKMVKDNICEISSSFYNIYDVTTAKKLYEKKDKNYKYDYEYHAYVMSASQGSPWAALVFVGVLAGIAAVVAFTGM